MLLTATTRGVRAGSYCLLLDRAVHPVLGIGRLGEQVELPHERRREALGVGRQAALLNAPLGMITS